MYVIDITRNNNITDMLCGNNSMDAKNKTLNYIIDYTMANHNIYVDKDILDQNLNMDLFSLKSFLNDNYSLDIEKDLIVQSITTDKDNCLFLKYKDDKTDVPIIYTFNKKQINTAHNILTFLVNDSLIEKYKDDLSEYNRLKLDYDTKTHSIDIFPANIKSEIISLYNYKGMFLEELLNNACSLNQIKYKDYGGFQI